MEGLTAGGAQQEKVKERLQKLVYIHLNKKTQILTPTILGEKIYDVVNQSIPTLLKRELTEKS